MNINERRVFFTWDDNLMKQCDRLPAVLGRASLVLELIRAYDLLKHLNVVNTTPASENELRLFHSNVYVDHLKTFVEVNDDYCTNSDDEKYGFAYDCPPLSHMYHLGATIAGSSITAAKCLLLSLADVAINWCGGWHHAQRSSAEGFCYVNDIVIAIEKLRLKFTKVLYIDIDVHHGNGVQNAYNLSKSVFTLSFHKYAPGFYPLTGSIDEIGSSEAKGFACNFPLFEFYSDNSFKYAFERTFELVYKYFLPDAIVVQCGADALANDIRGGGGLTLDGYCSCIQLVLNKQKPTMLLGGGGYNLTNTAKLWTSITALTVNVNLDEEIPEHDHWPEYGPDYVLSVQPLLGKDLNTREYLDTCILKIQDNLNTHLQDNCTNLETQKKRIFTSSRNSTYNRNTVASKTDASSIGKPDVYEFND